MANNHVSARTITIIIVSVCALFAAGAYSLGVMNMKSETPKAEEHDHATHEHAAPKNIDASILDITPDDVVIGASDAPVTIVEYSSLSCPHCANFHTNELPELQKELLDTGKAKLVLRQFPLNAPALRGAQLVGCAEADQRLNFTKVLFEMQAEWAFTPEFMNSLKQIAAVGGMNEEKFKACMEDKATEEALIASTKAASEKLKINATPSFFVNGEPFAGDITAKGLAEAVAQAKTK